MGDQYRPDVAHAASGAFVIVWNEINDGYPIQGRVFDAEGGATEFTAISSAYNGSAPAVAMDASGSFMVVWTEGYPARDVLGRTYDSTGAALGTQFEVATGLDYGGYRVGIMASGGEQFVVVWNESGCGECGTLVKGLRLDINGDPVGTEFEVSDGAVSYFNEIAIDGRPGEQFVVAWSRFGYGLATSRHGAKTSEVASGVIEGRRLTSDGTAIGDEFEVNTEFGYAGLDGLGVATAANGDFVIAWSGDYFDGDDFGVAARLFDSSGTAVGDQFQVNTYTTNEQGRYSGADVAYDDVSGEFVVTWSSGPGQDGYGYGVFAQRLSSAGAALGTEFQVNTFTDGQQGAYSGWSGGLGIASGGGGEFVVTWTSEPQDGSGRGIFAQKLGIGEMP